MTDSDTDEVITRRILDGDIELFGELISRYEAKLKRYARKFLSRPDDIEDLVQDVFIKAYTNIQSFDVTLRFSPWIYRIAHNTFVNELKRKGKYGSSFFDSETILPFIQGDETADKETLSDERKVEVEALLETLSPKYREVIVLHYFEDLSYLEISDVLQISVSAVGVRITRAREQLKKQYK